MTEEEAKTKACFRAATFGASQQLADGPGPNCIASACMAWRRQTVMIDRTTGEPAVLGVSQIESLEPRWSAHGYCGLAGAPQ